MLKGFIGTGENSQTCAALTLKRSPFILCFRFALLIRPGQGESWEEGVAGVKLSHGQAWQGGSEAWGQGGAGGGGHEAGGSDILK